MRAFRYLFSPASNTDLGCLLIMGGLTGLIALIPYVGWLLGLSVYLLWQKSCASCQFATELTLLLLMWLMVQVLAVVLM